MRYRDDPAAAADPANVRRFLVEVASEPDEVEESAAAGTTSNLPSLPGTPFTRGRSMPSGRWRAALSALPGGGEGGEGGEGEGAGALGRGRGLPGFGRGYGGTGSGGARERRGLPLGSAPYAPRRSHSETPRTAEQRQLEAEEERRQEALRFADPPVEGLSDGTGDGGGGGEGGEGGEGGGGGGDGSSVSREGSGGAIRYAGDGGAAAMPAMRRFRSAAPELEVADRAR